MLRGERVVARGTLGSGHAKRLPAGDYRVRFDSAPPHEVPVTLVSEQELLLVLEREPGAVTSSLERRRTDYVPCADPNPSWNPLRVRDAPPETRVPASPARDR